MKPADKVKRMVQAASFKASPEADKVLWTEVMKEHGRRQATDRNPNRRGLGRLGMHIRTTERNAAAILVVGVVIGVVIGLTIPWLQTDGKPRANSGSATRTSDDLQPDIVSMRRMAAAQDVKGLGTILSDGHFESRLVAANLLAKMAPLPALETVAMQAMGELRADRRGNNLRLYSTGHADWLELADSTITVHIGSTQQRTTLVRLIHAEDDDRLQQIRSQMPLDRFRKERADLEKQLATAGSIPGDVSQLRRRAETCSRILDLMDGAIYVRPAGGGLHLEDRVHRREADLFPSDNGVRAEWHGVTVDANSVTLQQGLAPVRTGGPIAPPDGWRDRFNQVYSLADGEVLRWVRPPFIPERQYRIQEWFDRSKTSQGNRPAFSFLSFRWDGTLQDSGGAMHEPPLESILRNFGRESGLRRYEIDGPRELLQLRLGGDWIVRTETPIEQRFNALEGILERELERRIRFVPKKVEREVIVVRGRYERRPLEGCEDTGAIYLFAGAVPEQDQAIGPREPTTLARLLDRIGERLNRPVIVETQGLDEVSVWFRECFSYVILTMSNAGREGPLPMQRGENLDSVLANLARQTSLEFSRQTRPFDMWFVTEIGKPNDANVNEEISSQK